MDHLAIEVTNLGKMYRIAHGRRSAYNYVALRDVIAESISSLVKGVMGKRAGTTKPREDFWALREVDFRVKEGQRVGIIGRNGAGKSTLLKLLSRITAPTEGIMKLRGRVASLLEVGTGFHPELTGRENIFLNGSIIGMSRAEIRKKFDEIVDFAEVEQFLDTPVKRYSSGMYLRLAFSVAAHLEPEILLVDEVLAVGDAKFQKKCLGKMENIGRSGRTILFVSHNMAAIRKLCSDSMLLDKGKVVMEGKTDRVIDHYLGSVVSGSQAVIPLPAGPVDVPAEGLSLRVLSLDRKPRTEFRLWEKWLVVLEFDVYRPISSVVAAVGLNSVEGVPIITYWSKPRDLKPGRYEVEFLCDVALKASEIQFAIGISEHERVFYQVPDIGNVSVIPVARAKQPFRAIGAGLLLSHQSSEIRRRKVLQSDVAGEVPHE